MFTILANLDCEARWANQTLPQHVLRRISSAAALLAAFAPEGEPVEIWTPADVDPASIHLPDVTLRAGVPPRHDLAWAAPEAKAANDRRLALSLHERLGTLLPGQRAITSIGELAGVQGRWVCKAPWTAAGRDRAHGEGPPSGELAVYLARLLERFGAVLFEPWCERVLDLGICGRIDAAGAITTHAPHTLRSDPRGSFLGIDLARPPLSDDESAQLARFVEEAGKALHAIGYAGPFGVDAFVHRTGERELPVFVVLSEDTYETQFGDGYHAYLEGAFRTRAAADAYIAAASAPAAPGEMTPQLHLRPGMLVRAPTGEWDLECELRDGESVAASTVVGYVGAGHALHVCEINARHTFGHVTHALHERFGATQLGFGPPPAGARILVDDAKAPAWITTTTS